MKTLGRLVRRYILTAVGITLGILLLAAGTFIGFIVWWDRYYGDLAAYAPHRVANALREENGALVLDEGQHTAQEWLAGYAWAMVLDDDGNVVWKYRLPPELDHRYTLSQAVAFARWYLDDWPTVSYLCDYGTFVVGYPKGTLVRWNLYMERRLFDGAVATLRPLLAADLVLVVAICVFSAWRMHKNLKNVEQGLERLAAGQPAVVAQAGATAELAERLNRTGEHLRRQNELIARRDTARTNWIAGVSHDIRTPLALIMGYAEQLQNDAALPAASREKAAAIAAQGQKIKALVSDLNLTSKLQYNAQPLRRAPVQAGPLLRRAVTDFCNSGLAERCGVDFAVSPAAEAAVLDADAGLLARAFENLLNNAARHNPGGCAVTVRAEAAGGRLAVTVADDGAGYPPAVLAALGTAAAGEGTPGTAGAPHILGLHLVEQIAAAHGGSADFAQNAPHGAKATVTLPLAPAETPPGRRPPPA